ncbi:capsule polysaccharide export system periplasmic protein [Novosphingobium nitrogenifigens DSM 19370]|uniref:Capsule polysaccharide export system periplasmic protein n=1 Tax=Novosphingobium nitrogenifigens DSM 19370 TaxID=983920 RepID=F1Z3V3_9SPHN|nr:SLBB domain-containing protein [Novosphingobium nitrogenifigens]EGD60723.1 capsule polysaccharide export system periplasmic protein [Novosphingobium nitrogenifigens DSM 19370]
MTSRFRFVSTGTRIGQTPRTLGLGIALAVTLSSGAQAQLTSPIGSSSQTSTQSATPSSSQATMAVPQTQSAGGYAPTVIEQPASDPREAIPAAMQGAGPLSNPPEAPPPPAPPSEFETYVSKLAGKPLRRFGSDLLLPEARDFTLPGTTAIPGDYRLNPGDQLLLNLAGSIQASALRLTIDSEGRIFVPRVGTITVGSLRYADLAATITREVGRQYRNFTVDVSVSRLHGLTVYVTGFARRPGAYTVNSLSTLVNAVMAAGGPAAGGSFRSIRLSRNGRIISDFDFYDLLLRGDKSGDKTLQNGDVIYVAPSGKQVAVLGSVNREAIFEIAPGETLVDAVSDAGGINTVADDSRLMVLDTLDRTTGWQQLSAADARNRKVERGQIVRVLSDAGIARPIDSQPVLVTVGGEVRHPGRYYFAPGTHLADVIERAGGLTSQAFPYAGVITRESVKAQQRESFARALADMELLLRTQPLVSVNRAQLTQAGSIALIDSVVKKMREREPSGRLVLDIPVTATSLPGDIVVENNDTIEIPTRPVTIGVFGSVASPASFAYRDGMTIGDAVALAGGAQRLADKSGVFVIRANGTVIAMHKATYREKALPGDLVYMPVDAARGEFWARFRDITTSLFGGLVGAASIKGLAG